MIVAVVAFFFINLFVIWSIIKKPGYTLVYFLFYLVISDIILNKIGIIDFRFFILIPTILIYLLLNHYPELMKRNILFALRTNIFWGIGLLLFIMIIHLFVLGGIDEKGYSLISKFVFPIILMHLMGAILIKNRLFLEEMSTGLIIFGAFFYTLFYLLVDTSAVQTVSRASIEETERFNAITLARICGMILIPSILYSYQAKNKQIMFISIAISAISVYWILVASTRGVILSVIIVLIIYFVFNKKIKRTLRFYFSIIIVLIIVAFNVINLNQFSITERFNKLQNYEQLERYNDYARAWDFFKENVVFGLGPAQYGRFTDRNYPHNIVLELLSEYGIFGLISISLIAGSGIYYSVTILRKQVFDYKINSFILIWMFFLLSAFTSGNLTINNEFWIMSGVMIAIIRIYNYEKKNIKNSH